MVEHYPLNAGGRLGSPLAGRLSLPATIQPSNADDARAASLPFTKLVSVAVWIIVASSWFVMVEPAPYDVLMLGLGTLLFATGLRIPSELGSVLLLLGLFIFSNIVSIIVAPESVIQPIGIMAIYAGLSVYLLLSYLLVTSMVSASEGRLVDVIWSAWVFAAIIASLLAVLSFFNVIPNSDMFLGSGRAQGAFKDPNVFGPFLVPAALILLSKLKRPGISCRLLNFAAFILLIFGLFLSFSRGAWGNFLLSMLVFAILHVAAMRSLKQYTVAATAAILILLAIVAILMIAQGRPEVRDMMGKRLSITQSYDVETGGRFWVQRAALAIAADSPLGIGPNRIEARLGKNPHNVYIKTLVENGWLGGIAFLAMIVTILLRGFRSVTQDWPYRDSAIVIYACLVGIAAESIIIDTLHWRHYFLLLGMMSGLTAVVRQSSQVTRHTTHPDQD